MLKAGGETWVKEFYCRKCRKKSKSRYLSASAASNLIIPFLTKYVHIKTVGNNLILIEFTQASESHYHNIPKEIQLCVTSITVINEIKTQKTGVSRERSLVEHCSLKKVNAICKSAWSLYRRVYNTCVLSFKRTHHANFFYADGSGGNSMSTNMGFQRMILIISNQGNWWTIFGTTINLL